MDGYIDTDGEESGTSAIETDSVDDESSGDERYHLYVAKYQKFLSTEESSGNQGDEAKVIHHDKNTKSIQRTTDKKKRWVAPEKKLGASPVLEIAYRYSATQQQPLSKMSPKEDEPITRKTPKLKSNILGDEDMAIVNMMLGADTDEDESLPVFANNPTENSHDISEDKISLDVDNHDLKPPITNEGTEDRKAKSADNDNSIGVYSLQASNELINADVDHPEYEPLRNKYSPERKVQGTSPRGLNDSDLGNQDLKIGVNRKIIDTEKKASDKVGYQQYRYIRRGLVLLLLVAISFSPFLFLLQKADATSFPTPLAFVTGPTIFPSQPPIQLPMTNLTESPSQFEALRDKFISTWPTLSEDFNNPFST
jgi:hypothetical protein